MHDETSGTGGAQQHDSTFDYMLLGRLRADCEYYLGYGNRSRARLWAHAEAEQIRTMRELYGRLPETPAWLSIEDIDRYQAEMLG